LLSRFTNRYVSICAACIRKTALSLAFLALVTVAIGGFGKILPGTFIPEEGPGVYVY